VSIKGYYKEMHPILQAILDDISKIEKYRNSILNEDAKKWRVDTNFFKAMESLKLSLIKFSDFIEKKMEEK